MAVNAKETPLLEMISMDKYCDFFNVGICDNPLVDLDLCPGVANCEFKSIIPIKRTDKYEKFEGGHWFIRRQFTKEYPNAGKTSLRISYGKWKKVTKVHALVLRGRNAGKVNEMVEEALDGIPDKAFGFGITPPGTAIKPPSGPDTIIGPALEVKDTEQPLAPVIGANVVPNKEEFNKRIVKETIEEGRDTLRELVIDELAIYLGIDKDIIDADTDMPDITDLHNKPELYDTIYEDKVSRIRESLRKIG